MQPRNEGRLPLLGVLLALLLGALMLAPSIALGDSASTHAAPSQYRGPSNEVPRSSFSILDSGLPTGGDAARAPEAWARWEFWFEHEKDSLLRAAIASRPPATVTGPGMPDGGATAFAAPRLEDIGGRALPALRAALRDPSVQVRIAAALALGNARDAASFPALVDMLRSGAPVERRGAVLALGFLGDERVREPLAGAVAADPDGEVRKLALLALGLSGDGAAAPFLREALARSLEGVGREAREFRVAAATALGLLGDRPSVQTLGRILATSTARDDRLRAHAATALGRIGDPAAVPFLVTALRDDGDASVRRSAALALGAFRGEGVAKELLPALDRDPDTLVRGFAAISLARAAGAAAVPHLAERTGVKHSRTLRGFAAAALGLTGSAEAAPVLRGLLALPSEDSLRGAASVALGLLGDRASVPALWKVARSSSSSPELQGYAVLGAAMTGDASVPALVSEMLQARGPADRLRGAALAAGVRPFPGSAGMLLRVLLDARDPSVRGAAILAIGLAPDRGTLPLLADIAGEPGAAPSIQRVEAAITLGQVALEGGLPPVARLAAGLNYRDLTDDLAAAVRVF